MLNGIGSVINIVVLIIVVLATSLSARWTLPGPAKPFGFWEASIGMHAWTDHLVARNLQLRHTAYVYPGIRVFSVLRGNRVFDAITPLRPQFDELFVEHLATMRHHNHQLSYSIKTGKSRYLRFPVPDRISMFDQVPGTEDLRGRHDTGYAGIVGVAEYMYHIVNTRVFDTPLTVDIGGHVTLMKWMGNTRRDWSGIEQYGVMRYGLGNVFGEVRGGQLAVRPEPLGDGAMGVSAYLGVRGWQYEVGVLVESIETEPIRTGIMVRFARSPVTEALGKVHFDYTRAPEGFVMQLPFSHGYWGTIKAPPQNAVLINKISVQRVVTYWQNGQGRNFYEHILSTSEMAEVDRRTHDIYIVPKETPWVLELESLVSPHSRFKSWGDLEEWERKRQGPAQLAQWVTYHVYAAPRQGQ